ncbi:MAG: energy transducer TonB [Gillisia sp.]
MKAFLLPVFLFSMLCSQAQEKQNSGFYTPEQLDQAPLFEGCTNQNSGVCTFSEITAYIQKEFNKDLLTDSISEKEKVMVAKFFIDTSGNAVHPVVLGKNASMKKELARVITSLPKLQPGRKDGKKVITMLDLAVKIYADSAKDSLFTYSSVDTPPIYKGCRNDKNIKNCTSQKIQAFVAKNMNISRFKTNGQWLKTVIRFAIDEEGKVINVTAHGINEEMNSEAIRVIKKLHDFTPATKNGKNVKVSYSLPIMMKSHGH